MPGEQAPFSLEVRQESRLTDEGTLAQQEHD